VGGSKGGRRERRHARDTHRDRDRAKEKDMAQAQTSRDDDALKKKTDCVYFLASPLTCKKVCIYVCTDVCLQS
jgi:hypothetical protein